MVTALEKSSLAWGADPNNPLCCTLMGNGHPRGSAIPDGLLGAGLYTAQWLYNLRHLGFPMFVIAYALLKDADPTRGL
jgi:hypothetical protein